MKYDSNVQNLQILSGFGIIAVQERTLSGSKLRNRACLQLRSEKIDSEGNIWVSIRFTS